MIIVSTSGGLLLTCAMFCLIRVWKMDILVVISVLSVMFSWILCTALSAGEAPTASTVTQGRHVRTKRCSCATFLDKECVYFCHLDIIWVNTPERVVSYGLGDAPRTRRAVADSMATRSGPRCQCARDNDNTCRTFCRPRYEPWPHSAEGDGCTEPQCKHKLAAHRGRINRMKGSNKKRVSPLVLRAASKTGLVLKNWRVRQHHRAREWEGESTAS